jgi:hypothetical protein
MSRQGRLDVRRQRPPRRPPPVPASTPAARAQDRLDGFRNATGFMLTAVDLLLNNTYYILILLDRARRARRIPTVLRQVLCEVMGRLDRTCHNFVTVFRCGERAHAFGPPKSKLIQRV